jgi:hypothetical protein
MAGVFSLLSIADIAIELIPDVAVYEAYPRL